MRWIQTFHLYKGFHRKQTTVGLFIKGSARVVEPPRLEYKGFKFKFNKKGDICRGLLVRHVYNTFRQDGSALYFHTNDVILLKKKQEVKSKYIYGPTPMKLKRKKFLALFQVVI